MKKTASFVLTCAIAFSAFTGSASAATKLDNVVDELIGTDYKYSGTTTSGFDCSGFTSYVFDKFGIELPRRSVDQAEIGTKITKDELRPGDLVFFNTSGKGISHVGIYMGDGKMAHSSTSHGVIIGSIHDSYYSKRYVTARRVLGQEQYTAIATEAPAGNEVKAAAAPVSTTPAENPEVAMDIIHSTEAAELSAEHEGEPVKVEEVVESLRELVN